MNRNFTLTFLKLLILLVFCFSTVSLAQNTTISGQVVNRDTGLPLQEVHVFIPNTTFQTFTDSLGKYVLTAIPEGRWELVAKKAGFTWYQEKEILLKKNKAHISSFPLVSTPSNEWALLDLSEKKRTKLINEFLVSFLSGSKNPQAHNLGNPEVLQFAKVSDSKEVKVYTDEYLIFANDATGYVTTVYLNEPFIIGSSSPDENYEIAYLDLIDNNPEIIADRMKKREESFLNSPEFFLRQMLSGELKSDIPLDSINVAFGEHPNEYLLSFPTPFEITTATQNGTLDFSGDKLAVHADGSPVFSDELKVAGGFDSVHLLDRLPSNFNSEKVLRLANIEKNAQVMQEKVYLQTDRKHYLKGETLFFKANMIYANPLLASELSKVLHIEIRDTTGYQEYHQVFPINNGKSFGSIKLPVELNQKNYHLRAFTSWSLNYGEESSAFIPFQVHDPSLKPISPLPEMRTNGVAVFSDKQSYGPKEKVILNVMVRNEKGNPIAADLAISILDMDQTTPIEDWQSINEGFELNSLAPAKDLKDFTYPLESRYSIYGELKNQDNEPSAGNVTALVNGFENVAKYKIGKDGSFEIADLTFEGDFEVAIQATDKEGLPIRDVNIRIQDFQSTYKLPSFDFPTLSLTKARPLTGQEIQANMEQGEVLLDEFILDEEKKDPVGPMLYGHPDNVVDTESLTLNGSTAQFIYLLSGKVAGMTVTGNPPSIRFRNGGEPLVMIDGVPINPPSGSITGGGSISSRTATEVIEGINVFAIDRVEIIKRTVSMLGEGGRNGIISIFMKSGPELEKANEAMKNNYIPFELSGFPKPQKFSTIMDDQKLDPILRSLKPTLFWNPELITNTSELAQQVQFESSESGGPMWVEIKGITAEGKPVEGRFILNPR